MRHQSIKILPSLPVAAAFRPFTAGPVIPTHDRREGMLVPGFLQALLDSGGQVLGAPFRFLPLLDIRRAPVRIRFSLRLVALRLAAPLLDPLIILADASLHPIPDPRLTELLVHRKLPPLPV